MTSIIKTVTTIDDNYEGEKTILMYDDDGGDADERYEFDSFTCLTTPLTVQERFKLCGSPISSLQIILTIILSS